MLDYLDFKIDFSDPVATSSYDELSLWSSMFGLMLLKYLPMGQNWTILDVGCGTGFPILELAQRFGPSCKVYGVDPWEAAVSRLRFKAQHYAVNNVEVHLTSAEKTPFSDGTFDLIVSNLGINNFEDPLAVMQECFRVAKPGARLVLTTNLVGHMQEFYDVFERVLIETGHSSAVNSLKHHINHRTTVERVESLFVQSGFTPAVRHQEMAEMRFVDGSAFFRHYFIKAAFLDAWKAVLEPDQLDGVFSCLEEKLNQVARDTGELRLSIPMAYLEAQKIG